MTKWFLKNRQLLLRLLGTLIAIGLIFVLVKEGGWNEVLNAFKQVSLTRLILGLALILVSRIFVSTRWYILLRSGNVKISYSDSTALTFTGLFANNFLPTTIGGDVLRLGGAMQLGYDKAVCLASIAADRLIGAFGMVFTMPFGLIPALHILGPGATHSFVFSTLLSRLSDFIKRTIQTFSIWLGRPYALLAALGCTWGHVFCTCVALYILITGLGGHVSFWLITGLWSVAYFVTLIPISINGLGVQELSLTFLFSTVAGLSTPVSLTIAVLIRAFYIAASLIGAFYLPGILSAMAASRKIDTIEN
jgi:glycosyltransferase 2 family protein